MRSLAHVLLISAVAALCLLASPAEASNAFKRSKNRKKSGGGGGHGGRKYPSRQGAPGRCMAYETLMGLLECASGPQGDADRNRKDFDILRDLIYISALDPAVLARVTVFAPDDQAFHRLAVEWGYDGKYDEAAIVTYLAVLLGVVADAAAFEGDLTQLVAAIILYHVADEEYNFNELRKEIDMDTLLADNSNYFGRLESERANGGRVRLRHGDSLAKNPKLHNRLNDLRIQEGRFHVIKNVLIFEELTALLVVVAAELEAALPGIMGRIFFH